MLEENKEIARLICLTQIASDSGKGIHTLHIENDEEAKALGYDIKLQYQIQAIHLINQASTNTFAWWIEIDRDQHGKPSYVTYFYVRAENINFRISFHNPINKSEELKEFLGKGTKIKRRSYLSNQLACACLIGYFNL